MYHGAAKRRKYPHQILNARPQYIRREAKTIAQACAPSLASLAWLAYPCMQWISLGTTPLLCQVMRASCEGDAATVMMATR